MGVRWLVGADRGRTDFGQQLLDSLGHWSADIGWRPSAAEPILVFQHGLPRAELLVVDSAGRC
ncbi:unannotated protein [freshwater metagenome]|uniref:Unannotated protein n=1 Tax=freshwater metagenome TaxID=449393 RepID=A0A6J7H108_9ZZZZ